MSNTTTPSKPNTFSAGGVIRASEVNANFDVAYAELQGNIGTANLLNDAITTAKILDGNVTLGKLAAAVQALLEPTGNVSATVRSTAPTGWVMASGRTIGSASSGATERANADTADLYTILWNDWADAEAPVSGGRGASAAADFAANKAIGIPDMRGRTFAGKDNMGGSAANRITSGGSGITGTTLGKAGGAETHTLLTAQTPSHTHTFTGTPHTHAMGGNFAAVFGGGGATGLNNTPVVNTGSTTAGGTNSNTGGDGAHNNTQPTLILNVIIKL